MGEQLPRDLSESEAFVLLGNRRRRLTLRLLRQSSAPLSSIELAKRIGDHEYEYHSAEELCAIHLSLYHNHLPRLDDADVVTYDASEGTVRPGPNFDDLVRVLDRASERDLPWTDG